MRINDFQYVTEENNQPEGRILLVGMLEDGPVGRGFTLTKPEKLKLYLGDNEMTRSYTYLLSLGISSDNILLYRLNGQTSRIVIKDNEENELLEFMSLTGSDFENNTSVVISEEGLSLISNYPIEAIESGARKNFKRTYRFDENPSLSELADRITNDAVLGLHNVIVRSLATLDPKDALMPGSQYVFNGGTSEEGLCIVNGNFPETYSEEYWEYFEEHILGEEYEGVSFEPIAKHACELMYFPDFPAEKDKQILQLAARVAEQKTNEDGVLCTALFRTSVIPEKRVLLEGEYFTEDGLFYNILTQQEEVYLPFFERDNFISQLKSLFSLQERIESSFKHLQIVVGENIDNEGNILPAALFYGGLYLTESIHSPLMNKKLEGFIKINTELTKPLVASLITNGYICIVPSIRKGFVSTRAQSLFYNTGTIMGNFYHFRILSFITRDIQRMLEQYIGKPQSIYTTKDIEKEITDYLNQYIDVSSLSFFDVKRKDSDKYSGAEELSIDLQFYNELTKIGTTIAMTNEGWDFDIWNLND